MHDPVYTVLEVDYPHPVISDFAGKLMTQRIPALSLVTLTPSLSQVYNITHPHRWQALRLSGHQKHPKQHLRKANSHPSRH
jgi:hypothetical protein